MFPTSEKPLWVHIIPIMSADNFFTHPESNKKKGGKGNANVTRSQDD